MLDVQQSLVVGAKKGLLPVGLQIMSFVDIASTPDCQVLDWLDGVKQTLYDMILGSFGNTVCPSS